MEVTSATSLDLRLIVDHGTNNARAAGIGRASHWPWMMIKPHARSIHRKRHGMINCRNAQADSPVLLALEAAQNMSGIDEKDLVQTSSPFSFRPLPTLAGP